MCQLILYVSIVTRCDIQLKKENKILIMQSPWGLNTCSLMRRRSLDLPNGFLGRVGRGVGEARLHDKHMLVRALKSGSFQISDEVF